MRKLTAWFLVLMLAMCSVGALSESVEVFSDTVEATVQEESEFEMAAPIGEPLQQEAQLGTEFIHKDIKGWEATAGLGSVAIDEVNFPDACFREYVKEHKDENSDGVLSSEERQSVWDITFQYSDAKNLKGIEYFPNLINLYCGFNELTSLDVSQNPELKSLNCVVNHLTGLDLSKNTKLSQLYCNKNSISSIDISNCPELINWVVTLKCEDRGGYVGWGEKYIDGILMRCSVDTGTKLIFNGKTVVATPSPDNDLSEAKVTVKNATYTGKALKPKVTVVLDGKTLTKGTDYTVSYSNNVKPGKGKVTVKGKGSYTGTVNATFKITKGVTKPATPTQLSASLGKDSDDDIITVNVSCAAVTGADGYEFAAKGHTWSKTKTAQPAKKTVSVSFKARKGEKTTYKVRAYKLNNKKKVYGDWATLKKSIISKDGTKKSVSAVVSKAYDEGVVNASYIGDKDPRYRVSVIDYNYDPVNDRTSLKTKITMYFLDKPDNTGNGWTTLVMAVDNLKKSDEPFRFVENGSTGYVAYSKWNNTLETYKKKKLKLSVDDSIDNVCVADCQKFVDRVVGKYYSYATVTANWLASGKVTDFRVKGTVITTKGSTKTESSYSFSTSGGSVTLKTSSDSKTYKGRWASVSCRMK